MMYSTQSITKLLAYEVCQLPFQIYPLRCSNSSAVPIYAKVNYRAFMKRRSLNKKRIDYLSIIHYVFIKENMACIPV